MAYVAPHCVQGYLVEMTRIGIVRSSKSTVWLVQVDLSRSFTDFIFCHTEAVGSSMHTQVRNCSDINWACPRLVPVSWHTLKLIVSVGIIQGNMVIIILMARNNIIFVFHSEHGFWACKSGSQFLQYWHHPMCEYINHIQCWHDCHAFQCESDYWWISYCSLSQPCGYHGHHTRR